ncbi:NlpC/P60 family protein [Nocardia vulneris]|uniref:C40 family peptidase n=1 Tax=Nocardia vulneris TaxID=1141657 RepID=UPI001FCDF9A3|nr:bifunctional lytic transglycosylase/C40 family peptidase [Nocardia vulneris]
MIAAVAATVAIYDQSGAPTSSPPAGGQKTPSSEAAQDIPADRLVIYRQAAHVCAGLDWSVLAAIGKIETDHGRSPLPGVRSGENFAGAGGPMQFLQPSFDAVITRHGNPPGRTGPPSRYDPVDAAYAAAWYLCDSGAPADLHGAIFAYNHADWYVEQVLDQAARYTRSTLAGECSPGELAGLAAATAIEFACGQLGQPYVWGGNGPEVNGGWDCSGLVQAAYRTAGITLPRTTTEQYAIGLEVPENELLPGDLVFYGTPADIHHVGLYLGAGSMIHAPTFGIPVQVSSYRHPGDDFYGATRPPSLTSAGLEP